MALGTRQLKDHGQRNRPLQWRRGQLRLALMYGGKNGGKKEKKSIQKNKMDNAIGPLHRRRGQLKMALMYEENKGKKY